MSHSNVIDFQSALERRAARDLDLDPDRLGEPGALENAALSFFQAVTEALKNGARTDEVDHLVSRLDRVLTRIR
jgi:hypothetical protein